ncbi:Sodium:proton antiporter [Petrocella atlantisensis]|uniref:Sodium:proton antiporter n=1 Tax=Petrocella atlantisensis TaxID=2173034 RepID=A0A3P7RZ25_9FIRM|nr:MnhB domain-containing protein [Petrocella atlantisensis]MCF8020916.1 sodium:proton antiporter [Vallitaleaceae bacterium]VDN47802.1 Sodium:proton antiporter [Petrocella atlantisensis]
MGKHSELFAQTMGLVYPIIILYGFYIIYNGHLTPGGGFQGGAILAGVFTIQYLTTDTKNVSLDILNRVEKTIYLLLLLTGILIVFYMNQELTLIQKSYYLLLMNTLIGVKVSCGLTVIFYRFVLFESR